MSKPCRSGIHLQIHSFALACALCALMAPSAGATHYKYGQLTWRPKPSVSPSTVEFTLVNGFNRHQFTGTAVDGHPAVGDVVADNIGGTALRYGDPSNTISPVLSYKVISSDEAGDWWLGQALEPGTTTKTTIDFTYPTPDYSGQPWVPMVASCCRSFAEVNNPGGFYKLLTSAEMVTGNASPVSTLPAIVKVLRGPASTFQVPAADPDPNTTLVWRLATGAEAAGGGNPPYFVQPGPPNSAYALAIDGQTGVVTWDNSDVQVGTLWSCQVIIEDHDATTLATKTQIAVDFLIEVDSCAAGSEPTFSAPTPANGATLTANVGSPISVSILASTSVPGDPVCLNGIVPVAATLSNPLPQCGATPGTSLTWTPTSSDVGPHILSFLATDTCGAQTIRNFTIDVPDPCQGLPGGLLAWYYFNDYDDLGYDASGNHHDGVIGAAFPVKGCCGMALRFLPDNNVQEFYVPSSNDLNLLGAMSGAAWIRARGPQSTDNNPSCTEGTIFSKGGNYWFQIGKNNNQIEFQNEGSGTDVLVIPCHIPVDTCTHVAFVRTTSDGRNVRFFVNGVFVGSGTLAHSPTANTDPLMVGNYGFGNAPGACEFNGDLDDIRIYNRALTDAEIAKVYQCACDSSVNKGGPSHVVPHVFAMDWLHDAFPFTVTIPPGTPSFDTTTALIETGRNIAQSSGSCRFDIPGDTLIACVCDSAPQRLDLIFRILPGPGNYHQIGNRASGLRPVPTDNVTVVVPGGSSFWGQYMADNGAFGTGGNGVSGPGHPFSAPSQWDPNVWNSARMDTAELNLFPVSAQGNLPGLDPCVWAAMYHESDPKFATLGIVKNRCFVISPGGAVNSSNITCSGVPGVYGAAQGYSGSPTTKEYTKIIPDGLLTPGSHVEYFIRRSSLAQPAIFTMTPDTNRVTPQPGEVASDEPNCLHPTAGGSTDGHRWQQFGVLPDRWKDVAFGGQGMACMLYVDLDDGHGDESAWVTVADLINATHSQKFGAHNGWHLSNVNGDPNDPANFVARHGGQPGTSWDMFGIRGVGNDADGYAGSLGSRLSCPPTGYAAGKGARMGPTPDMLRVYYRGLYMTSGQLNARLLGPTFARSQDEISMLQDYLSNSAGTTQPRFLFTEGQGFASSETLPPHATFLANFLGVLLQFAPYFPTSCFDLKVQPVIANLTLGLRPGVANDVLNPNAAVPEAVEASEFEHSGMAVPIAGVYKPATGTRNWTTLTDAWDPQLLVTQDCVTANGRLLYMFDVLNNLLPYCGLYQYPTTVAGAVALHDELKLLRNPVTAGSAQIRLVLARADRLQVVVFDVAGRRLATLVDGPLAAGPHVLTWDRSRSGGGSAPPGVYFVRARSTGGFQEAKTLIVLR